MLVNNSPETQGYLLVHFSREEIKQLLVMERQLVSRASIARTF